MGADTTQVALIKPQNMTIYEALELKALFFDTLVQFQKIEVDLSQVAEIDCSGLQLMVSFKNDALKQKKSLVFTAHSREVIKLLELFNMTQFFGDPVVL
ncbi:STAS domain-containing protein [Psychromonas antarctica]|uniref:STAS domain-containing protein n=1 Tax=Psychromonas antarctica TaxID=67573 RepID=UPI001EE8CAA3|nr:STAS domain-containing protein [Psychromonas antarctica]MCG6202690.1 STAS domain-containing protein [Psychromonas antarctica]